MAIAPERMGIGIQRRFTTPGQHPYDTVVWERRDARIANFATGAVAFEQLGVEVPSTWSLNATNILAQKYFRGTLGTSEREWSLKQVVDRVVDTITAWGRKDGYFLDDAEAETFSDELKYLIIHQKVAFNSPVWFNIGVSGVPQQGSACQPYDALVCSPDGLVPIGKLVESNAIGTKVYDAHGLTKIVAVKANGRKPVLRIHTKAGVTLDVTPDHLVWRASGYDSGRFVEAGELKPTDQLSWHRTESWGGGTDELEDSFELPGRGYNDLKLLEIERIEELGENGVYDIQTESGEYLSGNLRVHNCFILAVKDSMDSILNWYTEEGTIFKGGSGAGVNLSKIRSSKEGLRGGGTASGPVSFMRGADASAGTIKSGGKCFKEGTLVATPAGWQTIEQLRIGDVVLTHKGPQKVADFMPNGVKQCFKVVTRQGYEVEVTAGHKFAYWDAEAGAFDVKPIEQFQPGDPLYVLVEPSFGGTKIPLLPPQIDDSPRATTTVEMNFPTELDDRLSYVLGLSYGDGELRTAYPYRLRVAFCKDGPGLASAERFSTFCEELFGDRPLNLGEYDGHFQLGLTRKRLVDFLVVNGIAKGKGRALGFPAMMFQAEPEVRAAFVAGIIDADGTYQRRGGWSVSSIDRDFLVEFQRLLLSLGVPSKLKISREARNGWQTLYRLNIVGHTFIDRLVRHIGPYSAKAQLTYVPSGGSDKGWGYRPSLYRNLDRRVVRRGGHRLVDRTLGSNNETSGYGAVATLTRHPDEAVANYAADLSTCVQVTLESVTASEMARTYDIEVQEAHLLSANGIYTSNTRRAAKMVILNADHPDIEDFIWCKAIEERKARALRDAGFDMDLDGKDSHSIQYQNANNSVRVTDEFMQAVLDDTDWHLRAISTGEVLETIKARDLFRQIAKAAWECADPGMQFDTTINRWHTASNTDRINASNPCCFVADTRVVTESGSITIGDLATRCELGLELPVVRTVDLATDGVIDSPVVKAWVAGYTNELVIVRTASGGELKCTQDHRFLTVDGDWVEARLLSHGTGLRTMVGSDSVMSVDFVHLPSEVAVYDIEVAGSHNFGVETAPGTSVVVHNSEYMHLDNSACNLASLNLLTFLKEDEAFDVEGFKAATEVVFTGQEIIVGNADYPTEKIAENSRRFRQLGIGYANLGALLMAQGLPYDSDEGRAWAGAITALLTGHSYATSARTAAPMGPFAGYQDNREPMLDVLRMHRDAAAQIDEELVPPELLSAAQESWDSAVEIAEQYGVRNSQSSVLAPTGTIGLLMDCDTTGIEPDLGLVKMKKLVGGGTMSIVNQTVPRALRRLGYTQPQIEEIVAYIDDHKSIVGAPHLTAEDLPVFACSMGDNTIHYRGHIQMMGAVQPFISGAISKTVNVPEEVTVEDIEQLHIEAWQLGLKAIAIYRDNCKVAQPLATAKRTVADPSASPAEVHDAELALKVAELEQALQRQTTVVVKQPIRERLPRKRTSSTFAFRVADCEGYVTVGEYEDGRPGEVFIKVSKQGSTLSGIMDAFSIAISLGLQHGVPLATFVKKYTNMRFEPAGMTDDPDLRIAQSLMDYIFRRLAVDYLPFDERAELGILTSAERTQQTLPGIEETITQNLSLDDGPQLTESSGRPASPATPLKPVAESDAPYCFQCGVQMQRAGSCHACPSCGTTSGCS